MLAASGDVILVVDNGGGDGFFPVGARGRLAFFDGADWWAYVSNGLWCVGRQDRHFIVSERACVITRPHARRRAACRPAANAILR